jgi:hypothetical protein
LSPTMLAAKKTATSPHCVKYGQIAVTVGD